MKVKIFTNEGNATKLEGEINAWLTEERYETISHIKQSYVYDAKGENVALVSIWYKEIVSKAA